MLTGGSSFRHPSCATPCVLIPSCGHRRRELHFLFLTHTLASALHSHALHICSITASATLPPLCAGKPSPMSSQVECPEPQLNGAPTASQADPCSELPGPPDAAPFFSMGSHRCRLPPCVARRSINRRRRPVVLSLTSIPSASMPAIVESTALVSYSSPLPPKLVPNLPGPLLHRSPATPHCRLAGKPAGVAAAWPWVPGFLVSPMGWQPSPDLAGQRWPVSYSDPCHFTLDLFKSFQTSSNIVKFIENQFCYLNSNIFCRIKI
jgi:hypothetical protein